MVTYSRALPGGGLVVVELESDGAHLWVERRTDSSRREGHTPPVLASAADPEPLVEIAADNVAVARAIQRWQAANAADAASPNKPPDANRPSEDGNSQRTDTNS
jgi:hypothetical protein